MSFCRVPAASLRASSKPYGESTCGGIKSSNVTRMLRWKPLHLVSKWPKASDEGHARFRKRLVGEKNAENMLMNTYALVIKLFQLHSALFFFALFLLFIW